MMRMMQHKLREEERDLMRSSCKKNSSAHSDIFVYLWFESALSFRFLPAVKDEDSDIDVPDDEGSGSDMEEGHPFKPRPTRSSFMAGLHQKFLLLLITGSLHLTVSSVYFS